MLPMSWRPGIVRRTSEGYGGGLDPDGADFDVGQICIRDRGMPDDHWHTVSLLRTVAMACSAPPWTRGGLGSYGDKFKRDVAVTSAAARLYERGFEVDALVRSGLGARLRGAVIGFAVHAAVDRCHRPDVDVPRPAEELASQLLDRIPTEEVPTDPNAFFFQVMREDRYIPFTSAVAGWIRAEPRVAELLCWIMPTRDAWARIEPAELERDAVQTWLLDRFLLTYLSDWWTSSLHAEHRWVEKKISSPLANGQLELRLVPQGRLNAEIARRAVEGDRVANSFTTIEEEVLEHLEAGRHETAITLVHGALFASPRSPGLRNALAFCLIPENPPGAEDLLSELVEEEVVLPVALANRAMAAILRGDRDTAIQSAAILERIHWEQHRCWLWDYDDGELRIVQTDDPAGHTRALLERARF